MARKLIDQAEAARLLGVSVEEINTMRDRKELFPYRDGDAWKFKLDDIERLKSERAEGPADSWAHTEDLSALPLEVNEGADSILLSEKELGQSGDTTSSTIIGKGSPHGPLTEGDIKLATPGKKEPSSSDIGLATETGGVGSDVKLVLGGSDLKKKEGSALSDLGLKLEPASSGKLGGSDAIKGADSEIRLADPTGGSTAKGKTGSDAKKAGGSDSKKAGGSDAKKGAEVDLGDEDVLSVKPGSDITRGATDSGIHLVDPKDSGLSLSEPLELAGSGKELLELGEADVVSLEPSADMEGATQLKSDDDFLLTPVQSSVDESDSGSQVIALDAEEEVSSGAFTPATSGMAAMLEEDTGEGGPLGGGLGGVPGLAGGPSLVTTPSVPEAPYSGWNVTGLVCCALLLLMTGMVMHDMIRNIWKWDSPYGINVSLMDQIEGSIGWMEPKK